MSALQPKTTYQHLAQTHAFPFQAQPWWLDAVCGPEGWDVALAFDDNGMAIGAMPFGKMKWRGLPVLRMPPLTAYHHIWLRDMGSDRLVRQLHWEHSALREMADQLPGFWMVDQQYAPSFSNGLPFHGKGFRILTRYTYELPTRQPPDEMWRNMESATRNLIRKAKQQVKVRNDGTPLQLYEILQTSFGAQGKKAPFSLEFLLKADAVLESRQMRTIYVAVDRQERVHAACMVVWDGNRAYGLLSGAHPQLRKSGAFYRVLWQALRDAAREERTFDFEGSMLPRIERVFRSFGARRVPYLRVVRYRNRFWHALAVLAGKNA